MSIVPNFYQTDLCHSLFDPPTLTILFQVCYNPSRFGIRVTLDCTALRSHPDPQSR